MTDKYVLYIGDTIKTVSLWVRRDGKEYPIYGNTRGRNEWYSFDTDTYENTTPEEPSQLFKEWLAHYYRYREGEIETRGKATRNAILEDQPDEDPVWYEVEILNSIGDPECTPEQEQLIKWGYEATQ